MYLGNLKSYPPAFPLFLNPFHFLDLTFLTVYNIVTFHIFRELESCPPLPVLLYLTHFTFSNLTFCTPKNIVTFYMYTVLNSFPSLAFSLYMITFNVTLSAAYYQVPLNHFQYYVLLLDA